MQAARPLRQLLISAALLLPGAGCTIEIYHQDQELAACGNSVAELGEQCDDGNTSSGDGCSSTCTLEACGNGVVDVGEPCDTGGASATCDPDCTFAQCGDGVSNPAAGEHCDDGNLTSGDACNDDCTSGDGCGNGVLDLGEECDTGGTSAGCDLDCTFALCGDGFYNPTAGEQCDTVVDSATCNALSCTLAQCGDGLTNITAGEQCDDGNVVDGDGCESDCTPTP